MARSTRAEHREAPADGGPADNELALTVQSHPKGSQERERACEMLVARYEGLVRACVQRYRDSPESADELMQVGYLGLLKAINNFDTAVGENLAAYAQPCVSGEIKRYFRDKRWQVRVRRPVQELRLEIRKASADLTQKLARHPKDDELAGYLDVSPESVREAQAAASALQAASLDAPLPDSKDEGSSLGDLLGEEDPGLERALDMESVRTHWPELPDREQRLLMMRFYGNMTQAQIGEQLGISQMHVSRLLSRALDYLRVRIAEPEQRGERESQETAARMSSGAVRAHA
jgi:RNA polymerase sigma-B factor